MIKSKDKNVRALSSNIMDYLIHADSMDKINPTPARYQNDNKKIDPIKGGDVRERLADIEKNRKVYQDKFSTGRMLEKGSNDWTRKKESLMKHQPGNNTTPHPGGIDIDVFNSFATSTPLPYDHGSWNFKDLDDSKKGIQSDSRSRVKRDVMAETVAPFADLKEWINTQDNFKTTVKHGSGKSYARKWNKGENPILKGLEEYKKSHSLADVMFGDGDESEKTAASAEAYQDYWSEFNDINDDFDMADFYNQYSGKHSMPDVQSSYWNNFILPGSERAALKAEDDAIEKLLGMTANSYGENILNPDVSDFVPEDWEYGKSWNWKNQS